jgi:hypothetical protein
MTWTAMALTAETATYLLALFAWLRSREYSIAEAGAVAIVSVFMLFSLIHQIASFSGAPSSDYILEVGLLVTLGYLSWRRRLWLHLQHDFKAILDLLGQESFSVGVLAATWTAMSVLIVIAWLAPAGGEPLHWASETVKLSLGNPLLASGGPPLSPLNSDALFLHLSRFGLLPGACGFGLLAHLAVGLGTYALARRYAWPPMALTVTLVVVSMPRLVVQGIQPRGELIATAAVTVALVLLYRLVEQHQAGDLLLFLFCTAFSIHRHPMSLGLAAVLVLLLLLVMARRYGWIIWGELLAGRGLGAALALPLVLILAQVPVFGLNLARGYPFFGSPNAFANNGLAEAGINLLRYPLLSIDPTEALRRSLLWLTGLDLANLVAAIDALVVAPLAAQAGAKGVFTPIFSGGGGLGFGPLVPLLVMSAMVYAFFRGPRRLKAVSVAWAGYLYLAALVLAWRPDSLGALTPLYAANGFMVAFFLPPYRLRRRGMRLLQSLSVLLLVFSFYLALQNLTSTF